LNALSYTEDRLAESRHEAARLSAEVSQPAPARLQDLRSSRLRGCRASASEALFTEEAVLRAEEEELTARCRAAEVRVAGLRHEVRERQAQFGQMQQDLKDQIANLRKELNDAAGRRVAHDGGMQEQLRQLELLRHRELQHLRLQEEQLESLQYGEHWEEPVIFATSDPPARLVDPGLMEGSPPQRSYGPGRRSDLRQVMAPSSLVAHWPRDLEASVSSQFTQEDGTPQIKDLDPSGDESPPLPARSRLSLRPRLPRGEFEARISRLSDSVGASLQRLAEEDLQG